MADCEIQLWSLVREIEPTQTQKDGAKRSQNHLRSILSTGQMEPRILESYLSGSYSRDTAIYPLDDVDIIFVIDPSFWKKQFNIFLGTSDFPDPSAVLGSFANAIRYRYPVSSVFGQRRSVRLQLYHLDIDIVPAISDRRDPELIRIPDTRAQKWILSSPKRHSKNATNINKEQGGKFKPLVKLLKLWNGNLPRNAALKSFAIETLAVRVFHHNSFSSLQEGLLYFFDFVTFVSNNRPLLDWTSRYDVSLTWVRTTLPDAAETGSNLLENLTSEHRTRFVQHAIRSRNKVNDSLSTLSYDVGCKRLSEALRV